MTDLTRALSEIKRRAENVDTLKSGVHITIREDVLTEALIEMVRARDRVVKAAKAMRVAALSRNDGAMGLVYAFDAALAALDTPPAQEQKR